MQSIIYIRICKPLPIHFSPIDEQIFDEEVNEEEDEELDEELSDDTMTRTAVMIVMMTMTTNQMVLPVEQLLFCLTLSPPNPLYPTFYPSQNGSSDSSGHSQRGQPQRRVYDAITPRGATLRRTRGLLVAMERLRPSRLVTSMSAQSSSIKM